MKKLILGNKNFVVFGTGELGKNFFCKFKNKDSILFFVDNNEHFQDESFCEKKVYKYSKDLILKQDVDFIVICANSALPFIYNQLKADNICENKILIASMSGRSCLYGAFGKNNDFLDLYEVDSINSLFISKEPKEDNYTNVISQNLIKEINTMEIINSQKDKFYE